ncbi:hypothetical protein AAGG74_17695 [Bacillus mexicanus]|uniref:hypothetical protein n=1 Tax=Bacillus mexicanus TaxID=2834415 RepID=UPI003D1FD679
MNNMINKLREAIRKHEESNYYGQMDDVAKSIESAFMDKQAKLVHSGNEDSDERWSKWSIQVYKITDSSGTAYFQVEREEGSTESQTIFGYHVIVFEVVPKEVVVTQYEKKSQQ